MAEIGSIDDEARDISIVFNIKDRNESMAMKEAFTTLKDDKENFANRPTYRLINPSKTELARISKQILEEIKRKLVNATNVNQWKNKFFVLQSYKQLPKERDSAFICFDVVEFYPSISEALLHRALDFASQHTNIPLLSTAK